MIIGKSTLERKYYLDITIHKVICGKMLNESTNKIGHECRLNLTFVFTGPLTELPNSVNLIF